MAFSLTKRSDRQYRGRFAPSPSGLLHFGSLIAALASYLDAKSNQGSWLVRIEDIDPPREQEGASKSILKTLESYGLYWDESVLYQSSQSALYDQVLSELQEQSLSYFCQCTRAEIKALGGIYQGHCKALSLPEHASSIRIVNQFGVHQYNDLIQGKVQCDTLVAKEDFIVKRKDGLYAYQLAVVVDDIFQGISHVIRGCDLLEPTARQLTLFKTFGVEPPHYGHFPLAVTNQGYKLSKQNKAPAIDLDNPRPSLIQALRFLGQQPHSELVDCSVDEIIAWSVDHWDINNIPKKHEIPL